MADITETFTVTAGFFVRKKVFSDIREVALEYGLSISMDQAGGTAQFAVTGPRSKVSAFLSAVSKVLG